MAIVWVLTSGRTGDDKQSLRIAAALGVPTIEKKIVFNERAQAWRLMFGPSLTSVDLAASSPLEAPWPDLILSTGWRQVPVVRALQKASGGHTKLVQMNRPPGPQFFDLVLSPPQYSVPMRPNVLPLDWPLQPPPDPARLAEAAIAWKSRLASLARPRTVLLLGGESFPFLFDPDTVAQLFDQALAHVRGRKGSLLISTSRRTPKPSLATLRARAEREASRGDVFLFEWQPDADENPFIAFLAEGDEFIVTPDSISMLVEVARLGRPLAIAPYAEDRSLGKRLRHASKRLLHGAPGEAQSSWARRLSDFASLAGLKYARNLSRVSESMVERGFAARFPEFGGQPERVLPDEDFERIVERVRGLLPSERE